MNTDFRIAVGFTSHHKTIKLMRRCGDRAFFCLLRLWDWAAQYRPDGNLAGMDDEAIEIASDWQGDIGIFAKNLEDAGFLDGIPGSYILHDWCDHNPWACKAKDRSDVGRLNKLKGKFPDHIEKLKEEGVKGISKEEYNQYVEVWSSGKNKTAKQGELRGTLGSPQGNPEVNLGVPSTPTPTPTPTPSPSPSPSPTPTPTPRVEVDVEGKFAMCADWVPSEFFSTLASTAGIVPPEGEDLKRALQEFVPFWMTKNRKRTAHEWDLAFIKAIKSGFSSARNGPKAGGKNVHRLSPRQAYMQEVGELLERIDGIDTDGRTESIGKAAQPLSGSRPQLIDHRQASP